MVSAKLKESILIIRNCILTIIFIIVVGMRRVNWWPADQDDDQQVKYL